MSAAPPSFSEVREKQISFYSQCFGSLVLCVAIHFLAPVVERGSVPALGLVILFFGCLASAFWSLAEPYREQISATYRWRYVEASPAIRDSVNRFVRRQARYMGGIGVIGTLASSILCVAVLSEWDLLASVPPNIKTLLYWAAALSFLAIPIYAVLMAETLREATALRRQFEEEAEHSGVRLNTNKSAQLEEAQSAAPAVGVNGPLAFRAGGYDWTWGDFYKNAAIFGQSGTGKTLCVLNAVLEGLIASAGKGNEACSGLILDPKGDFRDKIEVLARKHGRSKDLLILDPGNLAQSIRWNPLDSTDDALELAGRFGAVMETISPSGGNDKFWIESSVRLVQNLIAILRAVRPDVPPSLADISDAAMSDTVLEGWAEQISVEQAERNRSAKRAIDYVVDIWSPMPSETKGSIRAFVANMLGSFIVEPYDELFSGQSTVTVSEMVDSGKILYVYMPIADKEVMAKVVSTFIKLEFYREVLKRPNKRRPSFFLCDEFQSFFTVGQGRGDADAFERTRQSNHANIVAFQNLNALFKQTERKEPVWNLLGNCASKIFLRNTENETNEYASALFGEQIENLTSVSVGIGQGSRGQGGSRSLSTSAQYLARIKKDEFTTLAVPSQADGIDHAAAIAHLAARSTVEIERLRWRVHPITAERAR